ncbi:hypothetical protein GCM10027082_17270 [Comamonas humi]
MLFSWRRGGLLRRVSRKHLRPRQGWRHYAGAFDNDKESSMLKWAIIFAIISLVAGVLGFTGIAAGAAGIAKILFFIFVAIAILFVVLAMLGISLFS